MELGWTGDCQWLLLGKGWPLGSRLWRLTVSLSLSHWYPGLGVVLDCIDSWSLHPYLFWLNRGLPGNLGEQETPRELGEQGTPREFWWPVERGNIFFHATKVTDVHKWWDLAMKAYVKVFPGLFLNSEFWGWFSIEGQPQSTEQNKQLNFLYARI